LFEAAGGLDAEFGTFLHFLCYTGCRISEALRLTCNDFRLSEAFAFVRTSKNGDPRPVFLPPVLVAQMANHPRRQPRFPSAILLWFADATRRRLFRYQYPQHQLASLARRAEGGKPMPGPGEASITPRKLATLRALSAEAYQPKLFEPNLTAKEAEKRITALKAEIELANSF
jgi:integrase